MINSSIEKVAGDIGFDIGASDDVTQAELLNGFCKGVHNSMTDDHHRDTQLCYIANKLTPKSKLILSRLNEFLKTTEENN